MLIPLVGQGPRSVGHASKSQRCSCLRSHETLLRQPRLLDLIQEDKYLRLQPVHMAIAITASAKAKNWPQAKGAGTVFYMCVLLGVCACAAFFFWLGVGVGLCIFLLEFRSFSQDYVRANRLRAVNP